MKAFVYVGPKTVELRNVPVPDVKAGYALIKVSHAGVCGSDLTIYAGAHPRAKAPLVLGHELSGTLESDHPEIRKGTEVTCYPLLSCGECNPCKTGNAHICDTLGLIGINCDGGLAEYVLVPSHLLVPIPEGVGLKLGAFIEPLAVGVHAVRKGGYVPGDSAAVFGCGAIGLVCALMLRQSGCENLTIVDNNAHRLSVAEDMGFSVLNADESDVPDAIRRRTGQVGADCVFDCAGHPSVAGNLVRTVKAAGRIVGVASYKAKPEIDMTMCMFKELTFQFVRVYTRKDFEIAADRIQKNSIDFERIITHVLPPEDVQKGFELLTTKSDAIKVMFSFHTDPL
ncbi:MAG: alcohol dehydrogenase catalytic domain-containing protein [Clostridiales Family XIII bacterium]|jgi:2-desacetyl-2-hydroxyethyl bacteriochlorophyllide A dehydrogenase|nr:alcohol dehydrogenase catalytic domain-containing protein [Clostridiales Family XIII bacterium]